MSDLFSGNDQPNDNLQEEILNKWKDKPVEDLLNKIVNADLHIKTIEREKAEMYDMYKNVHEELQTKAKFEDYLDQLRKPPEAPVTTTQVNSDNPKPYDPTEIETLFDRKLSDYETKKREAENFGKVQATLRERFGSNYADVLKDQQTALGLTPDYVNGLAKTSPEAFFRLMGIDTQKETYQAPPRSSQRSDSFAPRPVKRDWSYYQNLKKSNPLMYLDPKISAQMERDAQELGDAFGMPSDTYKF